MTSVLIDSKNMREEGGQPYLIEQLTRKQLELIVFVWHEGEHKAVLTHGKVWVNSKPWHGQE